MLGYIYCCSLYICPIRSLPSSLLSPTHPFLMWPWEWFTDGFVSLGFCLPWPALILISFPPIWEGGSRWGILVNPWLIHVSVWQKPLQYCKVISLQLIKINEKKKKTNKQKKLFYLFICLHQVLVVACGIFIAKLRLSSHIARAWLLLGIWDTSFLARDQTCVPCTARQM